MPRYKSEFATTKLKMKNLLKHLPVLVLAAVLAGCGDSDNSAKMQAPDPATQPEAQAALFERTLGRVKGLIEIKDYKHAQGVIDLFKNYKLTPEQQKIVDQFQAQIP